MNFARVLAVGALTLLVGLAGWLYSRESLFRLSDVQVESKDAYLAKEVQKRWVGLLGRPLFSISLEELERQTKAQFNVEHIVVKRKWPSTLSIQITEKDAFALRLKKGRLWMVDRNCEDISIMMTARALPLLQEPQQGSRKVRPDADSLCEVISEIESFENPQLKWENIDEIYFQEDRGWSLRSYEKELEIVLGHKNLFAGWQKAAIALAHLSEKGIRPKFLEASHAKRVVFKMEATFSSKLQNLKDELNLNELLRRAPLDQTWGPAAR